MTDEGPESRQGSASTRREDARPVDAAALLGGRRELLIVHGAELYRLRLTSNNKLILTK